MKLSIIINNFNYDKFLSEAIESVISQTDICFEFIIVDDGSTDNSRHIINQYKTDGIVILKQNGGQASAFNAGFSSASGEWIMFLDADDILNLDLVKEIKTIKNIDDYVKVHWYMDIIDGDSSSKNKVIPERIRPLLSGDLKKQLLSELDTNWPPTSGNIYKKEFLNKVLPIPEHEWKIAADAYLNNLAPLYGNIYKHHKPLSKYRIHGDNHWTRGYITAEVLLREIELFKKKNSLLENHLGINLNKAKSLNLLLVELNLLNFDASYILQMKSKRKQVLTLFLLVFKSSLLTLKAKVFYILWLSICLITPQALISKLSKVIKSVIAKVNYF